VSLISVIIPMRNAEPYVRAAVESVLAQKDVEIELIVVDDGSTDRSAEVVRGIGDPRVRIIPGPQKGISASFNAGLAEAKGEFLARCDADDLYPSDRLARQSQFLREHTDFGAISGGLSTMSHNGKMLVDSGEYSAHAIAAEVTDELRKARGRSHMCAYLFRTDLLRTLGGCREFFVTAEDVDLQLRLSESTRIWHDPRPAYLYRLHDASITHVQKSGERSFFEECARTFQKQRRERGSDDLQLGWPPPMPSRSQRGRGANTWNQIQRLLLGQAWAAHASGARWPALKLGIRAWVANPLNLGTLRSVFALALKPAAKPATKA
jgi:glycosyltransferase involved in cell wall biosynthesis